VDVHPFRIQDEAGNVRHLCVIERAGVKPYDARAEGSDWYSDLMRQYGPEFGFYTPAGQPITANGGARYYGLDVFAATWE